MLGKIWAWASGRNKVLSSIQADWNKAVHHDAITCAEIKGHLVHLGDQSFPIRDLRLIHIYGVDQPSDSRVMIYVGVVDRDAQSIFAQGACKKVLVGWADGDLAVKVEHIGQTLAVPAIRLNLLFPNPV